jgi:hypothetical protein
MNPLNPKGARQPSIAIERVPWTAQSWYETYAFVVTVWRVVWVGSRLYLLGPAVGIAVMVGALLATWCLAKWLPIVMGTHLME